MNIDSVELIGYLGSILVAISLMMRSLLRLRIINLVGALFFTIYGILLDAYPVAFLNGLIVCIDLYYLIQMWRQKHQSIDLVDHGRSRPEVSFSEAVEWRIHQLIGLSQSWFIR